MTIVAEMFARLREIAGQPGITVEVPDGATVAAIRRQMVERLPEAAALLNKSAIAVNECYGDENTAVRSGDRIAVLPPVSGG
jgi:molybdopterin converting factor subunit 1